MRIHRNGRTALVDHKTFRICHPHIHLGHITQQHRTPVAPVEYHFTQLLDRKGTGKTQGIAPLANIGSTGRDILVGTCQLRNYWNLNTQTRGLVGIKGDTYFAWSSAAHLGHGHTTDTLIAGLYNILDKIQIGDNIAIIARQRLDNKPGDCPTAFADGTQHRLIGIIRVTAHPVQAIQHINQPALQVSTHGKGNRNAGAATLCRRVHLGHALQATQHLFLWLDDFSLDFLRGRCTPAGGH